MTGLDHHLSRLKYLRDHAPHDRRLPHTPYFKWEIGAYLPSKIEHLLIRPTEKKLKEELLEITVVRDSVAHPKFYIVKDTWRKDDSWGKSSATLSPGVKHRDKAKDRKRTRSERTKLLALPIVSTWICYRVVTCVMVINRFLHLLARKYGNPYAHLSGLFVHNNPDDFFNGWGNKTRRIISFDKWTRAFYNSLTSSDQKIVKSRLGSSCLYG